MKSKSVTIQCLAKTVCMSYISSLILVYCPYLSQMICLSGPYVTYLWPITEAVLGL